MRRAWALLIGCLLVVAGGCSGAADIAEVDLLVAVDVGASEVRTGEGFPLTVTRIWRKDIEPSPWDDGMLSPLVVRPLEVTTREDRLRVEETRTFRAYAFSLESLVVPPVLLVGRSIGGSGRVLARSESVALTVHASLPAGAPGDPELPTVPEAPRSPWLIRAAAALGLLLLLGVGLWMRARQREPDGEAVDPYADAQATLQRLLARPGDPEDDVCTGAAVVRRCLGRSLSVPADARTTEELVPLLPPGLRADAHAALRAADLVKFAALRPDGTRCTEALTAMEALVARLGREAA